MKSRRKLFEAMRNIATQSRWLCAITLVAVIGFVMAGCETPATGIDPDKDTVAKPTASPAAGEVASGTMVTLSTSTQDAEIWYTTNGSVPAKNGTGSTKYETPIAVTTAVTIKAIAVKDGMNDSAILEAAYTIAAVNTVAKPIASPAAGEVASDTTVTLSSSTTGAEIWYTTNGSAPAKNGTGSTKYETPIAITAAVTIKAIAVKDGMNDSTVLEAAYTIVVVGTVAKPAANPAAGAVASGTTVTLSTSTTGAEIWYTTNGNAPAKNGAGSTKYETSIAITAVVTIKAIAVKDGMNDSAVLEAAYTIIPKAVTPTADPPAGVVASGTTVALATVTEGAAIHYTINGDTPTANSTEYTNPITITADLTIKAIAVKEGMIDSDILEAAYIISRPIATIYYGETEIPQNGTINADKALITLLKQITVVIKNTGTENLAIDQANITITGTDADSFSRTTAPGSSVLAGGQTQFVINFTPTKQGEHNAVLEIPTNDSNRNPVIINLQGTGVQGYAVPEVRQGSTIIQNSTLTPQVDFGQVIVGSNTSLTFGIENIGNIMLLLTGTPVIESSNTVFTIPTQPAASIAAGAEVSFNIQYTPTTEGEDAATITFANNSDDLEFSFTVKGRAVNPTPAAEDFVIGNLTQVVGSVTAVSITPKMGKSSGDITIYYNGSTTLPTTAGTYPVTFDVAATIGWDAATDLAAGTLTIIEAHNFGIEFTGFGDEAIDLTKNTENDIRFGESLSVTVSGSYDTYQWYVNGTTVYQSYSYFNATPGSHYLFQSIGTYTVTVVVTKNGVPYSKEVTFRVVR